MSRSVFVTGGTGYIGSRLITVLLDRGLEVRALVREESLPRLTDRCIPIIGDALDGSSFATRIAPAERSRNKE